VDEVCEMVLPKLGSDAERSGFALYRAVRALHGIPKPEYIYIYIYIYIYT